MITIKSFKEPYDEYDDYKKEVLQRAIDSWNRRVEWTSTSLSLLKMPISD